MCNRSSERPITAERFHSPHSAQVECHPLLPSPATQPSRYWSMFAALGTAPGVVDRDAGGRHHVARVYGKRRFILRLYRLDRVHAGHSRVAGARVRKRCGGSLPVSFRWTLVTSRRRPRYGMLRLLLCDQGDQADSRLASAPVPDRTGVDQSRPAQRQLGRPPLPGLARPPETTRRRGSIRRHIPNAS